MKGTCALGQIQTIWKTSSQQLRSSQEGGAKHEPVRGFPGWTRRYQGCHRPSQPWPTLSLSNAPQLLVKGAWYLALPQPKGPGPYLAADLHAAFEPAKPLKETRLVLGTSIVQVLRLRPVLISGFDTPEAYDASHSCSEWVLLRDEGPEQCRYELKYGTTGPGAKKIAKNRHFDVVGRWKREGKKEEKWQTRALL